MSIRLPSLPLLLLAAVLALVTTTAAWAQNDRGRSRGQDERGQRSARPEARRAGPPKAPAMREPPQRQRPQRDDALADAIRRVERSTRGQVISAERMQSDGRDISRIKVMDDRGRVRVYTDDPQQRQRRPQPPTRGDDD